MRTINRENNNSASIMTIEVVNILILELIRNFKSN